MIFLCHAYKMNTGHADYLYQHFKHDWLIVQPVGLIIWTYSSLIVLMLSIRNIWIFTFLSIDSVSLDSVQTIKIAIGSYLTI